MRKQTSKQICNVLLRLAIILYVFEIIVQVQIASNADDLRALYKYCAACL